jgi:hypothetical protein
MAQADPQRQATTVADLERPLNRLRARVHTETSIMNRPMRNCHVFAAAVALALTGPVSAQYPYGYPPYGYGAGAAVGNALAGQAQVIQANGQMIMTNEQARIEREKYYQERLVTKKQKFDLAQYERANTPTPTENQEKILGQQLRRVLNTTVNPAEIKRGDTLNLLMPYIKSLSDQGSSGPPTPVDPALLRTVNVKVGTAGAAPGAGLLKDAGKLNWPIQLRGPRQKEIDKLLPKACSQAAQGTLELPTYTKIVSEVESMREELRKKYHKEQISGSMFLGGQSYLDSLSSSLKVLQRPDAGKFFDGSYTAQGSNVPELVNNMISQGLSFAPATPGQDAAYFSLHSAFVSYTRAAQSTVALSPNYGPSPKNIR